MAKKKVVLTPDQEVLNAKAKGLGAVMRVDINDKVGFFKVPNRYAQGLFYAKLKTNHIEAMEIVLKNSIIASVSTIDLENDGDFFACIDEVPGLMDLVEKKSATSTLL